MSLDADAASGSTSPGPALLIGASRGLGLAMAEAWVHAGRHVVATVRGTARTGLHDLADRNQDHVEIETIDITVPAQIAALRGRLEGRLFADLFVNGGIATHSSGPAGATTTEDFVDVMVTNALGPMRVIEAFQELVAPNGIIGVMSSGQGSVTNNEGGGDEVYRGSKAALNTFMRSYAARHRDDPRSLVLMAPGWVKTDLGGPGARLEIGDSIPNLIRTLESLRHEPGLHYVDYLGRTVPW